MAHGDNPADRYNHRSAQERDRERPIDGLPPAINGVKADGSGGGQGEIEHFDAAIERDDQEPSLFGRDDRAGAGGAPDAGPGQSGGTLGTGNRREQDM